MESYFVIFVISLVFGVILASFVVEKSDKSILAWIIRILIVLAISSVSFGSLFLINHAIDDPFKIKQELDTKKGIEKWSKIKYEEFINNPITNENVSKDSKNGIIHYEIDSGFDSETFEYSQKSVQTATIFFTIAGIALGSLGVFWLAHLEATRLDKDRKHDQKVQKDRLLSLLSLGIDLFKYIDKEELDFVYECDKSYTNEKCISWKGKRYYFLTSQIVEKNKDLEIEYQKHITSIYKFLYEQKSFKKNTILSDIHKIIDELKILYYEKDLILFDKKDNQNKEKRAIFIKLLKQYNDYNNFLLGNTIESDFSVNEYKLVEKKLSTLLNQEDSIEEPINYLKIEYDELTKNKNEIFFDYFCEKISKEFTENYLIKQSDILTIFQASSLDGIFKTMSISHLDASKFFVAYFSDSFKKYILNKKEYMHVNLKYKDLKFDEYLTIIQNSFSQIHADIESVKELYTLFNSFVELYENYEGK